MNNVRSTRTTFLKATARSFWRGYEASLRRIWLSSTDQSCERQITDLVAFADRGGFEVINEFEETASGTTSNRAARNEVMAPTQAREIDAILVTELSRWGRSTQDLLDTLHKLADWNVSVVAMSGMTFELDPPHGRMMATILAGIAQFERDLISERVKSGLAAARARGRKLVRQPGRNVSLAMPFRVSHLASTK